MATPTTTVNYTTINTTTSLSGIAVALGDLIIVEISSSESTAAPTVTPTDCGVSTLTLDKSADDGTRRSKTYSCVVTSITGGSPTVAVSVTPWATGNRRFRVLRSIPPTGYEWSATAATRLNSGGTLTGTSGGGTFGIDVNPDGDAVNPGVMVIMTNINATLARLFSFYTGDAPGHAADNVSEGAVNIQHGHLDFDPAGTHAGCATSAAASVDTGSGSAKACTVALYETTLVVTTVNGSAAFSVAPTFDAAGTVTVHGTAAFDAGPTFDADGFTTQTGSAAFLIEPDFHADQLGAVTASAAFAITPAFTAQRTVAATAAFAVAPTFDADGEVATPAGSGGTWSSSGWVAHGAQDIDAQVAAFDAGPSFEASGVEIGLGAGIAQFGAGPSFVTTSTVTVHATAAFAVLSVFDSDSVPPVYLPPVRGTLVGGGTYTGTLVGWESLHGGPMSFNPPLRRGDTRELIFMDLKDKDGIPTIFSDGDVLRFTMKHLPFDTDDNAIVVKTSASLGGIEIDVGLDSATITLLPDDTLALVGDTPFVWDLQLAIDGDDTNVVTLASGRDTIYADVSVTAP